MRRVDTGRTRTTPARPGRKGQRLPTRSDVFGSVDRKMNFDAVLFHRISTALSSCRCDPPP